VSERDTPTGNTRGLVWTSAACISVSLLWMMAMAIAGPSVSVPAMAHTPGGPPWWVSLGLPDDFVLFTLWAAAIVAAVGVGAGLLAVARGARPRVKPLLAVSFIAIAVFTVLPPAGSSDAQSYAIDGNMLVLGHSPYADTPKQMAVLGDKLAVNSPATWQSSLSDYGPVATAEEWVSAELGGSSMAAITFWLKLWVAISFGAVVLMLDRLLRGDAAMRLRAHLLWSVNPLLLWEIVASGHVDGLAIALGLGGVVLLRYLPPAARPSLARCVAAGALLGAAAATKSPFAAFAVAAVWAVRRSPAAIAALAGGWLAVVVPSYVIAGMPAVRVLFARGASQVTWDNLYQVFYRPFGLAGPFGATYVPSHLVTIALVCCVVVALLAFFRLPDGVPGRPAVTPALALSLAFIFFYPFQRPWYDVMIIALLALYPRSWLDAVVLVRLCFGAITYMESATLSHFEWVQHVQLFEGEWITPTVRMLTAAALVWMCVTGRWGTQPTELKPPAVDKPVRTSVRNPVDNPAALVAPESRVRYCSGQRQSMNSPRSAASGPARSMADGRATPNATGSVTGPDTSHSGSSARHCHWSRSALARITACACRASAPWFGTAVRPVARTATAASTACEVAHRLSRAGSSLNRASAAGLGTGTGHPVRCASTASSAHRRTQG